MNEDIIVKLLLKGRCWRPGGIFSEERCYVFFLDRMNVSQAKAKCEQQGGVLAQIYSRNQQIELQDFIREKIRSGTPGFWLGMIHHHTEHTLEYSNGTTTGTANFKWHSGHPSSYPNVLIEVAKSDRNHGGLMAYAPTSTREGTLCEI